jgi:hypothetical protein
MREILLNTLACGSASAISPAKNLHGKKLEMMIQKYAFLVHSSASILLRRRAKYSGHCVSTHLPRGSQNGSDQKHLLRRLSQAMKQSTLNKRREQRSALQIMILIMRTHHHPRAFQSDQVKLLLNLVNTDAL